jgi:hypothetical protein
VGRRSGEAGRVAIDEHRGDGGDEQQRGGDGHRATPTERETKERQQRGAERACERQADLLDPTAVARAGAEGTRP